MLKRGFLPALKDGVSPARTDDWPGLKAVAAVTATRDGEPAQTRIFLLSEAISAETAASLIRGHWGIENSLHWVRDVTLREDAHRARAKNAPVNFAMFRRTALNGIKADRSRGSNRLKFKRAGWDDKFLRNLIAQI